MSQPLVSIIIPTYNSKSFIKETVASAINQTYKPIEIIVIDDGSTDGTETLFVEFESQGVHCFRIPNGGASYARNFGLSKATGVYIQFLDADDILSPLKIEKQVELMLAEEADLCYSPWLNFKNTPEDAQKVFRFSYINHAIARTGRELMISFGMENWFILTISWLVKKELIEKAGYWNPVKCPNDDGEYFSRVLFWAQKVVCCNENLAFYRKTLNDSLSTLNTAVKVNASYKSFIQIEALLKTCNDYNLLSYPKRLYYMQYKLVKKDYPGLAKRAARHFDRLQAPCFLIKKRYYWKFVSWFGLYYGTKIYKLLQPIWDSANRK